MKAATLYLRYILNCEVISIHAAREGGDYGKTSYKDLDDISIHAAREGGDMTKAKFDAKRVIFQSTPPVKAATRAVSEQMEAALFQSTPPVKAATRYSNNNI